MTPRATSGTKHSENQYESVQFHRPCRRAQNFLCGPTGCERKRVGPGGGRRRRTEWGAPPSGATLAGNSERRLRTCLAPLNKQAAALCCTLFWRVGSPSDDFASSSRAAACGWHHAVHACRRTTQCDAQLTECAVDAGSCSQMGLSFVGSVGRCAQISTAVEREPCKPASARRRRAPNGKIAKC